MLDSLYQIMKLGSMLGLLLEVVPITVVVGLGYGIYRTVKRKRQGSSIPWGTELLRWLFVCYLMGLINLVLVPNHLWTYIWFFLKNGYSGCEIGPLFSGSVNLEPTLLKWLTGEVTLGRWVVKMLIGNFLMFLPMGFFLAVVPDQANGRSILKFAVLIPIVIEVIQPVLGRSFDVDDLILNFLGILAGCVIAYAIRFTLHNRRDMQ